MRLGRYLRSVTLGLVLAAPLAGLGDELPAAPGFSAEVRQQIEQAIASTKRTDEVRSRHLHADGRARYTNRLILETSPYLLQHAHNPVNWYPWGDAAFAAAREQQKPILLSIGYSTCHWCHVMEDESFDNLEIAEYLNANYIAIKVDREERPDIDRIYMAAVEAFGGNAGWPMTVWLTPGQQPFYGGSYFPPYDGDRGVQRGFLTLLTTLQKVWAENRSGVGRISDKLVAAVRHRMVPETGSTVPGDKVFGDAFSKFAEAYDPVYGGLSIVPKFASHLPVRFLLRHYQRSGDPKALEMATHTLEQLARGGINDQVGGGFHRYATDAGWQVPHFEKMLYDNALLALTYVEAYQVTGDRIFAEVCKQVLNYASRDMRAPGGAFFAASDADSETPDGSMEEGAYFTWNREELASVLNGQELEVVTTLYGVADNAEERNILHIARTAEELAEELEWTAATVETLMGGAREKLLRVRSARPQPYRDTKILTAWNALMISAFTRSALYLDEPRYLEIAERAARFVFDELEDDGRLLHAYVNGRPSGAAFADDYAYLIQASIDLYEASGNIEWFRNAVRLQAGMTAEFEDTEAGGFYFSTANEQSPLTREKPGFDGHLPSANAISVLNLLRLYKFTSDDAYRSQAERVLVFFGEVLETSPAAAPYLLHGLDFYKEGGKEIVIVTPGSREDAAAFLEELRRSFLPNHVLTVVQDGDELGRHAKYIAVLEGKTAIRGAATAYVCEHGICDLPTSDPEVFSSQISAGAR